jgi:hypothetical protein
MTLEEWRRLNPGKSINDYYAQNHPEDEMNANHVNATYHRKEQLKTPALPLGIYYIPLNSEAMKKAIDPHAISRLRSGLCPFGSGQGVNGKDYLLVGLNKLLYTQPVFQDGEELERFAYETYGAYIPYNPTAFAVLTKDRLADTSFFVIIAGMVILGLFGLAAIVLTLLDVIGLSFDFTIPGWFIAVLFASIILIVVLPRFLSRGESIFAKVVRLPEPNSNWKYGFQQSGNGYPHSLKQAELSTLVRQGKLIPDSLEWTK